MRVRGAPSRVVGLLAAAAAAATACAGTQPRDLAVAGGQQALGGGNAGSSYGAGSGASTGGVAGARAPGSASGRGSSVTAGTARAAGARSGRGPGGANVPAGGNGGATDVGVTATEVKLGGFFIESGPVGSLGITLLKAAKAAFNEVNARGGIYGRKVVLVDCDTSFTSGDKPRACYSKLTQQDKVFAFAASGDGPAWVTAAPLACKAGVPGLWLDGLAGAEFQCPTLFPTGPSGRSQSHVLADYYVRTEHPRTVGVLYENDDIGNEWRDGAKQVFAKYGVRVVSEQSYNLGDTNFSTQVTNMRFANPDFVFFADEPLGAILFQKQAEAVGFKPPKPMAGVTCNVSVWPQQVGDYSKGMYCQNPWQLLSAGLPEQRRFEQTYRKYFSDFDNRNYYTEIMWVAANSVIATLKAAGPHLTRQRVLDVLRGGALNGYDTGFGVRYDQHSSAKGNVFDTKVAVIRIVDPNAADSKKIYQLVAPPKPDPYFAGN